MSIRIEYGGVTYFCESPEEAVALGKLLTPASNGRRAASESSTNGNGACITELVRSLKDGPKRLLRAVVDSPNGEIRGKDLVDALGVHPSAFGGYLAAITKGAAKANISQRTFFQRVDRVNSEGKYQIFKVPHPAMAQVEAGLEAEDEEK